MKKLSLSKEYDLLLKQNNICRLNSSDIWAYPNFPHQIVNNYGWKIHISAVLTNAIDIAQRFFNLNRKKCWDFKIIASISELERLNLGYYGNSQVGKFITIYPKPQNVLETLEILHYYFHNEIGIAVGSDKSYKLNSNIYYRFGTLLSDIKNIDHRDKTLHPFKDAQKIPDYDLQHYHKLPSRYLILKVLKHLGPSGVFLGLDVKFMKKVIIRYACKYFNIESSNIDEADRLLSSSNILNTNEILKDSGFENIIDTFYLDNSVVIVTEFIEGESLDELAMSNKLSTLSLKERLNIFNQILFLINKLNKLEISFRDLSFSNVILSQDKQAKIIDFNYAISKSGISCFAKNSINPAGTYGFYNPYEQSIVEFPDRFSLAQFLYFLVYPDTYISFMKNIDIDTSYSEIVSYLKKAQKKEAS